MTEVKLVPLTETFLRSLEILKTGQCLLPSSMISHTTGVGLEVEQRLPSSKKLECKTKCPCFSSISMTAMFWLS